MIKIKYIYDNNKELRGYQTFPITNDMIEISEEELKKLEESLNNSK